MPPFVQTLPCHWQAIQISHICVHVLYMQNVACMYHDLNGAYSGNMSIIDCGDSGASDCLAAIIPELFTNAYIIRLLCVNIIRAMCLAHIPPLPC